MGANKYVGVDGCKIGWFYTALDHYQKWEVGTFPNIEDLWKVHHNATLILIDIPIGLPFKGPRACDLATRKLLGSKKSSSVFPPPCREAVSAKTYKEACETNKNFLGKKISLQAWHISKKIKEVDDFLITYPKARQIIRETHPEICFWALTGGRPMKFPKKKSLGFIERLELLMTVFPPTESIVNTALKKYNRKEVAKDDILDSIAASIIACSPRNAIVTIPKKPETDGIGLPMEIIYSNKYLLLSDT